MQRPPCHPTQGASAPRLPSATRGGLRPLVHTAPAPRRAPFRRKPPPHRLLVPRQLPLPPPSGQARPKQTWSLHPLVGSAAEHPLGFIAPWPAAWGPICWESPCGTQWVPGAPHSDLSLPSTCPEGAQRQCPSSAGPLRVTLGLSFLGLSSAVWGTGTSDRPRPPQQVVNPTAGGRGRTQPAAGPRRPPRPCVCRTSWSRQRCRFAVGGLHPRGALPMGASVSPSVGVCGDRPGKCAAAGGPGPRTRPWSQGGRQRPRSALRLT